ncbi:hypothetical protein [Xanthomarina sp.]|uniref:hypothetical protein n=1 Tax=Xanthomarina sp. TaxID=1931211 RepID=UPI002CB8D1B2|nr:hypothetical protein [Xanthomarina sp.]HLV39828.1 hypothetical protein [Xanthomarina sp.]
MKNTIYFAIVIFTILLAGCKDRVEKKEPLTETVIEESTVNQVPRESDSYFRDALASINEENREVASEQIINGINALLIEGKNVSGESKLSLDMAIDQLRNIAGKLADNFDVSEEGFKEAVANAEINIAHEYLATNDVYVLTPKDKVTELRLHKVFDHNLKNLEAGTSKLDGNAKKEGEKLKAEGEKLKVEYEAWKKRAEEHIKKTEAHFNEYQPEYVYPK